MHHSPTSRRNCLSLALVAALTVTTAGDARTELTAEQVRNATVSGVYDRPVTLGDGRFEGPPFVEGGASRPTLAVIRDLVVFGNLDGAEGDEAAVLLAENSGGSGEMIYLSVIALRGGAPESVGTVAVGDRTRIVSCGVSGAEILMQVVEAGPGDPACCPTQVARKTYGLENGTLKMKRSEVEGILSLALIAGVEWTAVEIDGEPVPDGARRPTAVVKDDRVAGFGGCNRYNASVREVSPGHIAVGPAAATKMACPEPQGRLEDRFFASLGKSTQYSFLAGRLALSGMDGETPRSILLAREQAR
jgi:heat shock protein HslJ